MDLLHAISTGRRPAGRGQPPTGFSLVELLITMAIAAILLAVAVPAMQQFLADQSAAASAGELADGLRLARTEAAKRGLDVTICASSNTSMATPTCSGQTGDGWMAGWIVSDLNGNLIHVQNSMRSITSVETDKSQVVFHANSLPDAAGTFKLTPAGDNGNSRIRTLSLSLQGKVKITKGSGS